MQEIAERLAQRNHNVTVATTKLKERSFKELNGVEIREFSVSGNLAHGLRGEVDKYRSFVLHQEFDAILIKAAQQWTFDALWEILPQIGSRKVHIPCGYSGLYDLTYANYFKEMPCILHQLDHLIFYAHNYRDINFATKCNIDRYSVIPNGASEVEFANPPIPCLREKLGISKEEFVFLTVGSPRFPKGHLEVAQAYSKLKLPFTSALILNARPPISENSYKKRLRHFMKKFAGSTPAWEKEFRKAKKAIERQSGKRVFLTNFERGDVVSAFFESDLFVFASHVEYSPLVLFEAAAAGLPFLSVPVGNAAEIAEWTQGGEICPAKKDKLGNTIVNPESLAEKMTWLAVDSQIREYLGKQGRKRWRERFSWDKISLEYEKILAGEMH